MIGGDKGSARTIWEGVQREGGAGSAWINGRGGALGGVSGLKNRLKTALGGPRVLVFGPRGFQEPSKRVSRALFVAT